MLPGPIYSGIDGSRQYEVGEPGFRSSQLKPKRGSGIFSAINENLRRKDEISYGAKEQRKTAGRAHISLKNKIWDKHRRILGPFCFSILERNLPSVKRGRLY